VRAKVALSRAGCLVNLLLVIVVVWLWTLFSDTPLTDAVPRLWALVIEFVVSVAQSIWHFLGG